MSALDPATPPEELTRLAADEALRPQVARNPNAPWALLVELWREVPEAFLDNPIVDLAVLEDPQAIARLPPPTAIAILGVEGLSSFHLDRFSRHGARPVREALLRHPRATPELIERLARGFFAYELAAEHPNTDPAFVEELARHDWPSVRMAVIGHPALSPASLARLAEDEDADVRRAACARRDG